MMQAHTDTQHIDSVIRDLQTQILGTQWEIETSGPEQREGLSHTLFELEHKLSTLLYQNDTLPQYTESVKSQVMV